MKLVDIGVNLANSQFKSDLVEVLARARDAGVATLVLTGTSETSSEQIQGLANKLSTEFPAMLFTTVGVHPHEASDYSARTSDRLRDLATQPGAVAIGETGLDFNRDYSPRDSQEMAFQAQLELAAEMQLPVFMHERDAHQRQFEILKHYRDQLTDGVIHCFTGDKTALFNYLDLNLHIGITGWICDERRGAELQRLVHNIPLNRLMLETDAPYLLPRNITPKPVSRRNEPAYLPWVLEGVAAHRAETPETIAAATTATAVKFFRLSN